MGAVSGMFGTAGGASGTGFAGPSFGGNAPINPLDPNAAPASVNTAYTGVQGSLTQQQDLLKALQAQNGLGNQSQVYNQLQGVVNGTGPNPAQAMLNQQTGTNVANQAALMAGQRGAGSNVGLLARQVAQQGANTQQQAVGQGASLQAEQSLNALANSGTIAGNQASNQINAVGANTTAQQNEQQTLLNALSGYNATNAGLQSNINSANASLANTSMQGQQAVIGGAFKAGAMALAGAEGGMVQKFGAGGSVQGSTSTGPQSSFVQYLSSNPTMQSSNGTMEGRAANQELQQSSQDFAKALQKKVSSSKTGESNTQAYNQFGQGDALNVGSVDPSAAPAAGPAGADALGVGTSDMAADAGAPAAAGTSLLGMAPLAADAAMANGGMTHDYRVGGNVRAANPSQKAVTHGNSYANDKIPAVLSEGEVVIPRDVMQSKDPVDGAARFVAEMMKRKKKA